MTQEVEIQGLVSKSIRPDLILETKISRQDISDLIYSQVKDAVTDAYDAFNKTYKPALQELTEELDEAMNEYTAPITDTINSLSKFKTSGFDYTVEANEKTVFAQTQDDYNNDTNIALHIPFKKVPKAMPVIAKIQVLKAEYLRLYNAMTEIGSLNNKIKNSLVAQALQSTDVGIEMKATLDNISSSILSEILSVPKQLEIPKKIKKKTKQ